MMYKEYDQEQDLNDYQDNLYEDPYGPDRFADTFGERIERDTEDDTLLEDEVAADNTTKTNSDNVASSQQATTQIEDSFGEAINTDNNPHLEEQLKDEQLADEAKADY